MQVGRQTNRAICLALALLAGLLLAPTPAAAWPATRRAKRDRKVRKVEKRTRPVRSAPPGKAKPGRMTLSATRRPRPVFHAAGELPPARAGTVRLYRGTGHPDRLQVARSMRGRPAAEVPRGDESFFGPFEAARVAERHAFGADDPGSEAVSTTTDLATARGFARTSGGAVMVYHVPQAVFERLPHGDRTTGERIFRYSVPEEYAVGVLRETRARSPDLARTGRR